MFNPRRAAQTLLLCVYVLIIFLCCECYALVGEAYIEDDSSTVVFCDFGVCVIPHGTTEVIGITGVKSFGFYDCYGGGIFMAVAEVCICSPSPYLCAGLNGATYEVELSNMQINASSDACTFDFRCGEME